jgi:hypothetical protein
MLFARVSVTLVFERAKSCDDARTSFGRLDDGIDIALFGCYKGIGEAVSKLGDFLLAESMAGGLGGVVQLALHRSLWAHDRDFCGGPGKVGIGADMFAGHDAIRAAVSLARDDGDFGNGGFRKREKQFRAVFDDAAKLLLRAGQKSGNILKSDKRNIESVAETHEACSLERSIYIKNSGEERRLIGDDADRTAVQPRKAYKYIFCEVLMDFE